MSKSEKLKQFFEQLRGKSNPTATDIRKPLQSYGGEQEFIDAVNRARNMVQKFFVEKTLLIYDGRGAEFPEIINAIEAHGSGVLVLLDYIQRMPPADESGRDDYTRVKKISDGVWTLPRSVDTIKQPALS